MTEKMQCATDREIRDLLMSGKKSLTDAVLHELARDRGIFCSPRDSREALVARLSLLTYDYHDIAGIIERRDSSTRGEKTTSVSFGARLEMEEIKAVVRAYQEEMAGNEKVAAHQKGPDGYIMNVQYDEYDYSRTTLIQRQKREAGIEFIVEDGSTTIRTPATEKAKQIVEDLRNRFESSRKSLIPAEVISLRDLPSHEDRTSFFMSLIKGLPDFSLHTVTNLKVASGVPEETDETDDPDESADDEEASAEMLAIVRSVHFQGDNLVASPQYQELRKAGFYITAITWRSKSHKDPYEMVQFDASFENAVDGTGFKYGVRSASRLKDGEYAKTFKPVEENHRAYLFDLIESSSRRISADLTLKAAAEDDEAYPAVAK